MVEWKKLGEVCTFHRGKTITAKDAVDGDIPVIAGGQTPSYYHNESNREGESITVAGSGAYAGFVSYWNQPIYVSDAFTIDPSKGLKHKYLFHWAKMNQEKIIATQKGAGVPHVHGKDIANFLIPIPSLSEQSRIVSILDTFTSSISNLKQQIEERRKQYEYERDLLLDLEGKEGVEMKKLGEIMTIVRGASPRPITNYITNDADGVNWIKIGDVASDAKYITSSNEKITKEGAAKSRFLHSGDFILSNSMSFGRPYILKIDGCIHDGWIAMSDFEQHVSSGYLYEILNSNKVQDYWKMKANNGGAMTNLNSDIVRQTIIPIPSHSEQSRIVSILDTFEQSISNLEEQLAMREKQYEYYRNQLLTFEGEEERGKT